jgi:sulfoxide reductase heme-binding subunit YedZ
MSWLKNNWHRVIAHGAGILPLFILANDYLQEDPLLNRTWMLRTGTFGLIFLVASFACTPLSHITGWARITQVRRPLGLYGFAYATLHLLVYAFLDSEFSLNLIWRDLQERQAMPVGLVALVLLVPLAITSTRGWQRRLGKRWRTLHRLIYLAMPLVVLHYLWLDRDFIDLPLLYAAIVGLLLVLRLPPIRRAIIQARHWLAARRMENAQPQKGD